MLKAKQSIEQFYKYRNKLDELNKSQNANELSSNQEILQKSLLKEQKKLEAMKRIDREKEYRIHLSKEKHDKHMQNISQLKN